MLYEKSNNSNITKLRPVLGGAPTSMCHFLRPSIHPLSVCPLHIIILIRNEHLENFSFLTHRNSEKWPLEKLPVFRFKLVLGLFAVYKSL